MFLSLEGSKLRKYSETKSKRFIAGYSKLLEAVYFAKGYVTNVLTEKVSTLMCTCTCHFLF